MPDSGPFTDRDLRALLRDVPDFPKPGIVFKDITPALLDPRAFRHAVERLADEILSFRPEVLVAIEARGFLFASAIAYRLNVGLAPVRKPGKLPWRSVRERYDLEYGTDALEMHEDALTQGARAVVVDDVLATGGTAAAVGRLVERVGGQVAGFAFLAEIGALEGRRTLKGREVRILLSL